MEKRFFKKKTFNQGHVPEIDKPMTGSWKLLDAPPRIRSKAYYLGWVLSTAMAFLVFSSSSVMAQPPISNTGGPNNAVPCSCNANGTFEDQLFIGPSNPGELWNVSSTTLINPATNFPYLIGTPLTEVPNPANPAQSFYIITGNHLDGVGYTFTAVSPFYNVPVTFSNTCYLPKPIIEGPSGNFCANTNPVTFTGKESNGADGVGSFMLDGNPVLTVETPANSGNWVTTINVASLSLGNHALKFTFNAGGNSTVFPPNNVACIASVTKTFSLVTTPSEVACNDRVQVSLDEDCSVEILPDMILEGGYRCYDDYKVEIKDRGQIIGNTVNSSHIGRVLSVRVTHIPSDNSCWGEITVEDKMAPYFDCPQRQVQVSCADYPTNIPPPVAYDNCTANPTINLVKEEKFGDNCQPRYIVRTYIAIDKYGNTSAPCRQEIEIIGTRVTFPDDITWTCEQYAAYQNIIAPAPLHQCLLSLASQIDLAETYCGSGVNGDDDPAIAPYQANSVWWTDKEDLDVSLDPNYDDNIDNPLTDPNAAKCGTPSPEMDTNDQCNLSILLGCPRFDQCVIPGAHIPTVVDVPRYTANLTLLRGLEDADVLAATGSGVPNVYNKPLCDYAVTYDDVILEACRDADITKTFKILRTWTVLNWCTGQVTTDVQVIKVLDKKAPEITFDDDDNKDGVADETQGIETYGNQDGYNDLLIANQFASGNHGVCSTDGLVDIPRVEDNCSGVLEIKLITPVGLGIPVFNSGTLVAFRIPSPFLEVGEHTLVYEVSDACGNTARAEKRILVIDGVPPVPVCREVTQVALTNTQNGESKVGAVFFDEGSYDNCGEVFFKVRRMDSSCAGLGHETTHFNDQVTFCCEDVGKTINVILRVYDKEPPAGRVTLDYLVDENATNDCMIEVLVEDKVRPNCVAPADVWTTCAEIPANVNLKDTSTLQNLYGKAVVTDNCLVWARELTPVVNVDLCGVGSVTRRFQAKDVSGNLSLAACEQRITIKQVTSYELEIPGDFEDECTVANPDTLVYRELGCDLIGVNVEDEEFPASPNGECKKIIRTYQIINWCEYDGISGPFELVRRELNNDGIFGDGFTPGSPRSKYRANHLIISDGDYIYLNRISNSTRIAASTGYYQYKQHIKIYDDTAPALSDTLSGPFCGGELDEDPCTGFVHILPAINETCTDVTISWQLDAFNSQFQAVDFHGENALEGRYPLGIHTVRFKVSDECGNTSKIDITFEIIDCKAPTPVCFNGLSIELMQSGMVELWASDVNASSFDYCNNLIFRINRIEDLNGDGFITIDDHVLSPPNRDSVVFRCKDLGLTAVQLWVGEDSNDDVNNWDYCVTYIEVQDNMNACFGTKAALGGKITNEDNEAVDNVTVELNTGVSLTTDNDGEFTFNNLNIGDDYSVIPSRDDFPLNGVSTFDLVLISKHILNVKKLNSPYKIIAADANNSKSVSTLDLVALRKLILRVSNDLPNNSSWRFVDKNYVFANPDQPWNFPEVKNFNNIASNQLDANFIAVKVGDVNGDATANNALGIDNRSLHGNLGIIFQDRQVKAGEIFKLDFVGDRNVLGYQFTLGFDKEKAEFLDLVDGVAQKDLHFHVVPEEGTLTTSWNGEEKTQDQVLFSIQFRARTNLSTRQLLQVHSQWTAAEAYNLQGELMGIALQSGGTDLGESFSLYQNTPNPVKEETAIGFYLPVAGKATLTISDVHGRIIKVIQGDYPQGRNTVVLQKADFNHSTGIFSYQLESATQSASRQMIVIE